MVESSHGILYDTTVGCYMRDISQNENEGERRPRCLSRNRIRR